MAKPPDSAVEALVDTALNVAVRVNGPVKLYHGRNDRDGLFDKRTGDSGRAAKFGFGSEPRLWSEEPRAAVNQALFVRLLRGGLERLIESTGSEARRGLIDAASVLYRQQLLERWADLAAANGWSDDFPKIAECCSEMIDRLQGLIPEGAARSKPDASSNVGAPKVEAKLSEEDADFKRRMAHELVIAWKYSPNPEAKQSIANALRNAGIQQIGEPQERLTLDGGLHRCDGPAFPGDEVEVVESGWLVHDGTGEYLLEKAIVKLI